MTTKSLFPPDCRLKLITYIPLAIAILLVLFVQPSLATGAPAPGTRPADKPAIALPPFISIAAGRGTCAVTATGGVLCWGYGHPFPFYIRGLDTGIKSVAIGPNHICALTVTGGVKCWGQNNVGQLGDGTTIDRSTPVYVVGLDDGVQSITVGYDHTCALTAGGGVMCWGQNETGQLGDGTTTQRTTPVDVAGLTSAVQTVAAGGTVEQSPSSLRRSRRMGIPAPSPQAVACAAGEQTITVNWVMTRCPKRIRLLLCPTSPATCRQSPPAIDTPAPSLLAGVQSVGAPTRTGSLGLVPVTLAHRRKTSSASHRMSWRSLPAASNLVRSPQTAL